MRNCNLLWITALGLGLSACQSNEVRQVSLIVENNSSHDAMGVIDGIPLQTLLDSLKAPAGTPLTLTDETGQHVATQIFNDGSQDLLLFETHTLAKSESTYYVSVGQDSAQADVVSSVAIKHYPRRKDDLLWENESALWRAYGPTLQATGERAFGYDIWCKNTKELLGDRRMLTHLDCHAQADSLYKLEQPELIPMADSLRAVSTFHRDHGDGMDCYAVGATLGGGTAALLNEGHIVYPWAWKSHKILANGPLLAAVRLDYDTLFVGNDTVMEHRTIIAQKGTRFNIINVTFDGLTSAHEIAVGIVYHGWDDSIRTNANDKFIAYSDPTDQPDQNPGRVEIGAYIPTLTRTTVEQGHILGIAPYEPGKTFTYYMGSGWSKGDCPSLKHMTDELKALNDEPRTVRIVMR